MLSKLVLISSIPGSLGEALRTVEWECAGSNPAGNRTFFRTKFRFTLFRYCVKEPNFHVVVLAQWEHADLPIQRSWVRVDFSDISFSHQIWCENPKSEKATQITSYMELWFVYLALSLSTPLDKYLSGGVDKWKGRVDKWKCHADGCK